MARRDDVFDREHVCDGRVAIVAAVLQDKSCPALDFLRSLSPSDAAKLHALFHRYADSGGLIQDGRKFKRLDGDIWEFKARGRETGLRVTCYRDGGLLVLLTGFKKKEDQAEPREIVRAKRVMDEDRGLHGQASRGRQ